MGRQDGFEIGTALSGPLAAALVQGIVEAFTPKEARKQQQQQLLLEAVARNYDRLSALPPEERKKAYSQLLFPAYGVYQPPLFRKMFGAKPEAVLPLPEGGVELEAPVKTKAPFSGRRGRVKAGITLPPSLPFTFAPTPLIQPEHETELEKQAAILYPDSPEDQATWLKTAKTARMTGVRPSREDILWETITRAERMIDAYKASHPDATNEQAIATLPPNIKRRYREHVEKAAVDKLYKEMATELLQQQREALLAKPTPEESLETFEKKERIKAKYRPPVEKEEKETLEEKRKAKQEEKQIEALKSELKEAQITADRNYSRYLDILKRQMAAHNKQYPYAPSKHITDLTELPNYMSMADWLILHPEGKAINKRIMQIKGRLHYLLYGTTLMGEESTLPPGIPQGSQPAGKTKDGYDAYRTPEGKLFKVIPERK